MTAVRKFVCGEGSVEVNQSEIDTLVSNGYSENQAISILIRRSQIQSDQREIANRERRIKERQIEKCWEQHSQA